jgi:hypothetical protein
MTPAHSILLNYVQYVTIRHELSLRKVNPRFTILIYCTPVFLDSSLISQVSVTNPCYILTIIILTNYQFLEFTTYKSPLSRVTMVPRRVARTAILLVHVSDGLSLPASEECLSRRFKLVPQVRSRRPFHLLHCRHDTSRRLSSASLRNLSLTESSVLWVAAPCKFTYTRQPSSYSQLWELQILLNSFLHWLPSFLVIYIY